MTCLLSSGQGAQGWGGGVVNVRRCVLELVGMTLISRLQGPKHPSLWPCRHHPQALRVDAEGRDTLTPKSRGVPAVVSRLTGQVLPRVGVPG